MYRDKGEFEVIYEQRERVFHRDIQTRENNVWKHEREARVAKCLAHLPFTSKVAGSNLGENISMWLETSPHVKRVKVNALPKVVGFLRVLRFPPTGKVDRVG